MTPELSAAYEDAAQQFVEIGGAIGDYESHLHPWRVFLEVSSVCNLVCPTCTKGNQKSVNGLKYEHQTGLMDPDLMERCLDKIKTENPKAIVFLYGNSEPWLHPRLPECIAAVKARGLRCEISTNLNHLQRVEETLAAGLDRIIISLSGFTQDIYVRGHQGGNIEKVKANMVVLAEANIPYKVPLSVNYHIYTDNEHELKPMRDYANYYGIDLFTSNARAISIENSIQYLRETDGNPPFDVQPGQPDWNHALPPVSQQWKDTMNRLKTPPQRAMELYANYPIKPVCPVGAGGIFTFIRHDGKVQMCACTADRRITLGNYLDMTPDQMIEKRDGHAICKLCTKARLNLYFMTIGWEKWGIL